MGILDESAVSRRSEGDAAEILEAYISKTSPRMVHSHTAALQVQKQPTNTGAVELDPMK